MSPTLRQAVTPSLVPSALRSVLNPQGLPNYNPAQASSSSKSHMKPPIALHPEPRFLLGDSYPKDVMSLSLALPRYYLYLMGGVQKQCLTQD